MMVGGLNEPHATKHTRSVMTLLAFFVADSMKTPLFVEKKFRTWFCGVDLVQNQL
jgi:hypothetical protein